MIYLLDMGGQYWRNWYATRSSADAYELTLDQIHEYRHKDGPLIVCCDARSKRYEWFPEYKANRDDKPEEALESLRAIEQQVASWGVPAVRCDGYEADDVMASLADQAFLDEVRIISNDKDMFQCVRENVLMITKRGVEGEEQCVDKFGVRPDQMIAWQAMVGDTADNIPGCPSCGPGRARDLLSEFGTLEAIQGASDDDLRGVRGVGEKTILALREWDPDMALKLVTLLTDAPIELDQIQEVKNHG